MGPPEERISGSPVAGVGMNGFAVEDDICIGGKKNRGTGKNLRVGPVDFIMPVKGL